MLRLDKVLDEILKNDSDCNMIIQTSYIYLKRNHRMGLLQNQELNKVNRKRKSSVDHVTFSQCKQWPT